MTGNSNRDKNDLWQAVNANGQVGVVAEGKKMHQFFKYPK